jgi:hypothetical protein
MASLTKNPSSAGKTKHADLEEGGNDLGFVVIAQPVETTTEEVHVNDSSLNQSTHSGRAFVRGALLSICLITWCIVHVYKNPKQRTPTILFTMNVIIQQCQQVTFIRRKNNIICLVVERGDLAET